MKKLISELAIVAVLSLILAAVTTAAGQMDTMLALLSIPLVFGFAVLGLHRSRKRVPARQEARNFSRRGDHR